MLEVKENRQGEVLELTLAGALNENSNLALNSLEGATKIVFDLSGLTGINSIGISIWLKFLKAIKAETSDKVELEFKNCPTIFIDQVGLLPNFIPSSSTIVSFFAPYTCNDCYTEAEIHCDTKDAIDDFPTKKCPKCGGKMDLDDMADEFRIVASRLKKAEG